MTENERASMFREGIQSENLSEMEFWGIIRQGVDKENKLNDVYGNKYRILLDHEILKDHGVFFLRALSDELLYKFRIAPVSNDVIGSDETQLAYELTNIQPEYELIHSQELAVEVLSNYNNGKRFMYKYVCDACDERGNFEGCRYACFLSVADVGTILPVVMKPRKPR